jgi:hypothetical protein
MKAKLAAVLGIVALSAWFVLGVRSDYSWADSITKRKTADGWTIAATQNNFADLVRPWTWFKTPVTGLWFTKPQEWRKQGSIVVAPVLRISYDYSKTEQDEYLEIIDISTGKAAIPTNNKTFDITDPGPLDWHDYPAGSPGSKLVKYVQSIKTKQ